MTIRAGYIGLGIMGKALAKHLAPAGLPTYVCDLDDARVQELCATGAKPARSAREVAENADVIGICVPADEHVRAVMRGDDGLLAGASKGATVVISSTVHPDTVLELFEEAVGKEGFAIPATLFNELDDLIGVGLGGVEILGQFINWFPIFCIRHFRYLPFDVPPVVKVAAAADER